LIGVALALLACAVNGIHPLGHRRPLLLVRGGVGCFGIIGQVHASALLPVALVSIFSVALQPIAAAAAAFVLLAERPPLAVLIAMPLSVAGIVLVLEPWRSASLTTPYRPDALVAAALSPVCIGSAAAIVRKLSSPNVPNAPPASASASTASKPTPEDPQVVLLYLQLFAGGLALLACVASPSTLALAPAAWLPVVLCGLGGYLYQLLITMALSRARAAGAVTMESLRVIFTALADWLLFGILMDPVNMLGAAVVVASAAGIVFFR
jgi:drug/metabolite transporter (DMT)-like permease